MTLPSRRIIWNPVTLFQKTGLDRTRRSEAMSKLIKLLEKVVFFVAGAVIVFLTLVSKSDAAVVNDSLMQHMTSMQIQHQTVAD